MNLPKLNKVLLSGRIANDVEMRYTNKGTPIVRFTLAVDRAVKDANGQYQNQASFLDVAAWSKWAEVLNEYAHKGSPVIVEGHLEARSYVDTNNVNRKAVEVIAEYIQILERKTGAPADLTSDQATDQNTNDDVPF